MPLVEFHIAAVPPKRLDKALSRDVPEEAMLSRSRLVKLIEAGAVQVNARVITDAKASVAEGDHIAITVAPSKPQEHVEPEEIALDIVYEDEAVIVVNKPAGMVVHPAPGTPAGTLVNALLGHFGVGLSQTGGGNRPGIVHRIDKDTSGLLVVAKTDEAHLGLARQFADHSITRVYQAVCYGVPDTNDPRLQGVRGVRFESGNVIKVTTQLARHKTERQKQAVSFEAGRHAITRVQLVQDFQKSAALVHCWLETGRTHQIRVHMAHMGCGLIGDPVYGGRRKLAARAFHPDTLELCHRFDRQALHAAQLGFDHPLTGQDLRFEAAMPDDMTKLVQALGAGENASLPLE